MMKIVRFRGRLFAAIGVTIVCTVVLLRTATFLNDNNNSRDGAAARDFADDKTLDERRLQNAPLASSGGVAPPASGDDAGHRAPARLQPLQATVLVFNEVEEDEVGDRKAFRRLTPAQRVASAKDVGEDRSRSDALHSDARIGRENDASKLREIMPPGPPAYSPPAEFSLPAHLNRPTLSKPAPYPLLTPDGNFVPSRRIVHVDLKGAHPKFDFFRLFFPFLARLGATGVLMEYEDVFPYKGALTAARSTAAYSESEIAQILAWARDSQLEVVPLVQTFGHLEWILKHEKFAHYREEPVYPQVICLSNWDAVQLVKQIIDQVMRLHRNTSEFFHIGADEAYQVGRCAKCQEAMRNELSDSRERLMLRHIANISTYVKQTYGKRVLMWHDMLNNVDGQLIKEYKLDRLIEPVVWAYAENLNDYLTGDVWLRFSAVFPYIWGSSAYKGADGPSRYHSNVPHYLRNHISWLDQMRYQYKNFREFRGLILSGWQRYDHFAVLCEVLPVGIPSLVVNLITVNQAVYNKDVLGLATRAMMCNGPFDLETPPYANAPQTTVVNYCNFPGAKIYQIVQQCYNSQSFMRAQLLDDYQVKGWLSAYNIRHNFSSAWYLDQITDKISMHQIELAHCARQLRAEMAHVFNDNTIDEFFFEHIQSDLTQLDYLMNKSRALAEIRHFPLRPFAIRADFSAPVVT